MIPNLLYHSDCGVHIRVSHPPLNAVLDDSVDPEEKFNPADDAHASEEANGATWKKMSIFEPYYYTIRLLRRICTERNGPVSFRPLSFERQYSFLPFGRLYIQLRKFNF